MLVLPFPAIDPTLVEIGPFAIRWYALAYIVGLLLGWRYVRGLAAKKPNHLSVEDIDDLLIWITFNARVVEQRARVATPPRKCWWTSLNRLWMTLSCRIKAPVNTLSVARRRF